MKLTGAAIRVSRGTKMLQAAPAAYPYRSQTKAAAVRIVLRALQTAGGVVRHCGGADGSGFTYAACATLMLLPQFLPFHRRPTGGGDVRRSRFGRGYSANDLLLC